MFKKETLWKLMNQALVVRERYLRFKAKEIKMCISTGNSKIGHVLNVSLMPIMTCANCSECSKLCYDVRSCVQYPNVLDARIRNTILLQKDRDDYFGRIWLKCKRRRLNKYFRWHVAGDIVDLDYLIRMIAIARDFPDFVFWTYTKNYVAVNQYCRENGNTRECIPANLHIMFSEWRGMPMDNPYEFPEFRVVFKDEEEPKGFYCPGNSDVCKKAKRGCLVGETTYCREH